MHGPSNDGQSVPLMARNRGSAELDLILLLSLIVVVDLLSILSNQYDQIIRASKGRSLTISAMLKSCEAKAGGHTVAFS